MKDYRIVKEIIPAKVSFERLDKAKWWQKILSRLSNRYKCRFMDVTPLIFIYEDYKPRPDCIDSCKV